MSDVSDSLVIQEICSQKTSDLFEKFVFFCLFLTVFPLIYAQEQIAHVALPSFAHF